MLLSVCTFMHYPGERCRVLAQRKKHLYEVLLQTSGVLVWSTQRYGRQINNTHFDILLVLH